MIANRNLKRQVVYLKFKLEGGFSHYKYVVNLKLNYDLYVIYTSRPAIFHYYE